MEWMYFTMGMWLGSSLCGVYWQHKHIKELGKVLDKVLNVLKDGNNNLKTLNDFMQELVEGKNHD